MRPFSLLMLTLATVLPWQAQASHDRAPAYIHRWARVEVFDRTAGHPLPIYVHHDRLYVAGEPGHQYELRITNRSNERLLAVTSVDGVNVISGKTAQEKQSGYVLDPWGGVHVEGWRKSLNEVATFYFTRWSDSYAARTGRPEHVGVIGVAVFREQPFCCHRPHFGGERTTGAAPAPSAQADEQSLSREESERLGTGHGHREGSPAHYVDFQRASNTPDETIVIYYDSRKNLTARGVIRESHRYAEHTPPNPFPEGMFVPDP
ncbi:hypothetical protein JM946_10035 [Steroidobacter sp. S1-65]|uniref:Uncharacterized protein n=1 Tax=Steroidobacter gossypii TaxID=2805490 RepID=A0ABS1WVT3_9GAMM|nr:hypothetical protein [Steroidobacter gossypii]MBM0105091.1 hypothetical protein [Steroidobacter gossypii]